VGRGEKKSTLFDGNFRVYRRKHDGHKNGEKAGERSLRGGIGPRIREGTDASRQLT